ncbi:MAG TPA: hypothetical protein VK610_08665, partial [Rhodothermales bacterium]|nr:hypothetical protein [Rhodothermales bacterium]
MPDAPVPPAETKPPVSLTRTLGRLLQFARPYRTRLVVAVALSLLSTGVGLLVPLGLKQLLDAVFESANSGLLNRLAGGLLALFAFQA